MLKIDIKFTEENSKSMPKGAMPALELEIEKKLKPRFPEISIRSRKSTYAGIDISGIGDEAKKQVMETLEDIWMDDSWLPC